MSDVENIVYVNSSEELQDEVDENDSVIVDFYADWCGPCKLMNPVLEEIAEENEDVVVVKVDIDEAQQLAADHNVRSVPTFMFYHEQEQANHKIGVQDKSDMLEVFD